MIIVHVHKKSGYTTIKSSNPLFKERTIKNCQRVDINGANVNIFERVTLVQTDLFGKRRRVETHAKLVISLPRSQTVVIFYED